MSTARAIRGPNECCRHRGVDDPGDGEHLVRGDDGVPGLGYGGPRDSWGFVLLQAARDNAEASAQRT